MRFLTLAFVLFVSAVANAAALRGSVVLERSNLDTFDLDQFTNSLFIDVYKVIIDNPNASPVTSIGLYMSGDFLNVDTFNLTFSFSPNFPYTGPIYLAQTFFVVPDPASIRAVDVIDNSTTLAASFTDQDGATFVPAMGSSILAVLSVAAGSPTPSMANWTGNAAINGVLEPILFVPEPTACVLAGLTLVGFTARRRG